MFIDEKSGWSCCRFGIAAGLVTSAVVTLIIVTWEWLENPSGIFRDDSGTNWTFIWDTAVSWFSPTFLVAAGVATAGHLAWSVIRQRAAKD